jgi:hypothetical protein
MWQLGDNEYFMACLEQRTSLAPTRQLYVAPFRPPNFKSLTYVDQCASLKEFNKLKCRGAFFLSEQKKLMRQV